MTLVMLFIFETLFNSKSFPTKSKVFQGGSCIPIMREDARMIMTQKRPNKAPFKGMNRYERVSFEFVIRVVVQNTNYVEL
jgi:hypothetical protein